LCTSDFQYWIYSLVKICKKKGTFLKKSFGEGCCCLLVSLIGSEVLFNEVMNLVTLHKNPVSSKSVAVTPRKRNKIIATQEPTSLIHRETGK
jgi:hypothetical protein